MEQQQPGQAYQTRALSVRMYQGIRLGPGMPRGWNRLPISGDKSIAGFWSVDQQAMSVIHASASVNTLKHLFRCGFGLGISRCHNSMKRVTEK
jgi:hypothetical protein